ncbi:MAG: phytoene desaturase family protein [Aeromicrobium sp.]
MSEPFDVAIVGGGHNALVAATYLARAGLSTVILERLPQVGGAAISAQAFEGVDARLSRYAYLVSLFPEALIADLGLALRFLSRATASYTPYGDNGLLAETAEGDATRDSFRTRTGSDTEFEAWQAFYRDVSTVANAIAPTLLRPLPHIGDLRDQVEMAIWTDLIDEPLGKAVERRFADDLVRGVVATDALIGTFASMHDESLIQNRCFLYHLIGNGTGEWRVPVGGMGAVTAELERVARAAGAEIRTNTEVTGLYSYENGVTVTGDGFVIEADRVLCGVAPYILSCLLDEHLRPEKPRGAQLKINLLVDRLPRLKSGVDPAIAFAGTLHLDESYEELERAHAEASAGSLPTKMPGEIYCHTLSDPSILGAELRDSGAHTLTYFGLHTPPEVFDDPAAKDEALQRAITGLNSYLVDPIESVLANDANGNPCIEAKSPLDIEDALGMPGGHIFHGDLAWPWLEDDERSHDPAHRWGVATNHERILLCGSGARRGGAVSGIAGHNAAHAVLEALQVG